MPKFLYISPDIIKAGTSREEIINLSNAITNKEQIDVLLNIGIDCEYYSTYWRTGNEIFVSPKYPDILLVKSGSFRLKVKGCNSDCYTAIDTYNLEKICHITSSCVISGNFQLGQYMEKKLHRVIVEDDLRIELRIDLLRNYVHHLDGYRFNNLYNNLHVTTRKEHNKIHTQLDKVIPVFSDITDKKESVVNIFTEEDFDCLMQYFSIFV